MSGLIIYNYVEGNPVSFSDPLGLRKGANPAPQIAMGELQRTYDEMRKKNVKGTDQFFHCLAACRATKKSGSPALVRDFMNKKEWRDYGMNIFGLYGDKQLPHSEMIADMERDKQANETGIGCPTDQPCEKRCSPYLDNLPPSRRPYMQEY